MDHEMTDKKFQAENDVRTLVEAAKVKGDKARFDAAMKMAREQRKTLSNLEAGEKEPAGETKHTEKD